ncbi:hypothetical protein SUBVAR_07060 [Subdoligranulum variabile DSM 15176]|uniref:Uncharacterized protein n=2 Tax=Subdoligranulum variabile TaxID=214851 RepID=D1PRQ2_9FIRM|nr:hypothetical protein SUBVAR_07060 [Subdoligranulum variabile DSM 15176]
MVENSVETVENRVENWGIFPKSTEVRQNRGEKFPPFFTACKKTARGKPSRAVENQIFFAKIRHYF